MKVCQSTYGFGDVVFVRLENQGTKPLKVPTRNPSRSEGKERVYPLRPQLRQVEAAAVAASIVITDSEYNRPFKTDPHVVHDYA